MEDGVILFRAVTEQELEAIQAEGTYTIGPKSDGKYFYATYEQAQHFVDESWAIAVTSAFFSVDMLQETYFDSAATEGEYLYLPGSLFPYGPVTIHEDL